METGEIEFQVISVFTNFFCYFLFQCCLISRIFFSFFKQEAMISKQKIDPELEDKTQEAIGKKKTTCLKKIVPVHATGSSITPINFFIYSQQIFILVNIIKLQARKKCYQYLMELHKDQC